MSIPQLLEDFVTVALGERLAGLAGRVTRQDTSHALDADGFVALRPDLVWYSASAEPPAVVDARYKAEKPEGFPGADVYQLLA